LNVLRVGIVGTGFIARPHAQALRALREIWGDEVPAVELVAACDEDSRMVRTFAGRFGVARVATRWQDVTRDPAIDAVLVLVPNDLHAPVALDALRHGRHVLCEKPLALTVADAAALVEAADTAGTAAQVAFVYRAWPAMQLARALVAEGEIGEPFEFRGHFLHDYALDPTAPHTWRFSRERAGAGSLGDLGSHIIDLARSLMGEVEAVTAARLRTVVSERPCVGGGTLAVDVDDLADLWLTFESGAVGTIRVGWAAAGHQTDIGFEVLGDAGAVRFFWARANELTVVSERGGAVRRVALGPRHPGSLWPVPGVGLAWADAFVLGARAFVHAIAAGTPATPTLRDGLRVVELVEEARSLASDSIRPPQ
jgi:predicted dehydrogenase